jgi:signal peptidase II
LKYSLATAVAVFVLDRASKIWVVEYLSLDTRFDIPVWPPFLNLMMAWNTGVNFGLFDAGETVGRYFLIGLALAIVAVLLWWVRRQTEWRSQVFAGAIIGGALGNVWDRVQYGAVADFLNMSCCGIVNPFAFNVADVAIFVGAIGLVLFSGKSKVKA